MNEYNGGGEGGNNMYGNPVSTDDMMRMMCTFFQNQNPNQAAYQGSVAHPQYNNGNSGGPPVHNHGHDHVAYNRKDRDTRRRRSRSRSKSGTRSRSRSPIPRISERGYCAPAAHSGGWGHGDKSQLSGARDKPDKFIENVKHRNSLAWKACFRLFNDVRSISTEFDEAIYKGFNEDQSDDSDTNSESEDGEAIDRSSPRKTKTSTRKQEFKTNILRVLNKLTELTKCSLSDRYLELGENYVWVGQECGHVCHVQAGDDFDVPSKCNKCGASFRAPPKRISNRYKIQHSKP